MCTIYSNATSLFFDLNGLFYPNKQASKQSKTKQKTFPSIFLPWVHLEWNWIARLAQGSDSGYQTHDGKAKWMHNKKPRTSKQNPITIIIIIIIPIRSFTRETCSQAKERHTCKEKNFLKILHITRLLDVQVYAGSLYVLLLQSLKIFMFIYFYRYLCLCHLRGGQRNT